MRKALETIHGAMNVDFCPWANKYVYWLKKPIGWVVLALLASLLLGIYVSPQAFLATAAITAIGLIGCLWPWIAMRGIQGELSWFQGRCEEQESIKTTLTLTNRWPWPAFGLFVEADHQIASLASDPDQPICLSLVPGLAESQFEWECVPGARGVYPKRAVRLATAFPFGVWTCYRELAVESPLIVWPHTTRLVDVPESSGTPNAGIGTTSPQIGDEGDWMGVRPYRPGDTLRQVHWAQTARRDQLIVFERQSRARQEVAIWFDSFGSTHIDDELTNELIRILASIANHFVYHSWSVRVSMNGVWQILNPGKAGKQKWMDSLARWLPSDAITNDLPQTKPNALNLAISTTSELERLSTNTSMSDRISWILLDNVGAPEWLASHMGITNEAIVLDSKQNVSEQLDATWKRFSQRSSFAANLVGLGAV
jgi:hypothetical protein